MCKYFTALMLTVISFVCVAFDSDVKTKRMKSKQGKLVSAKLIKSYAANWMPPEDIQNNFAKADQDISNLQATATAVNAYRIRYRTLSVRGRSIIVSGLVAVPDPADGVYPVVQYQHCTQFDKSDVPSNPSETWESPSVMFLFAAHGYIVSMPDYIGQGKSRRRHPYMHAASMAVSSADMLKAVKELCERFEVKTDSRLFICGFSEGGHATMALQRYIESDGDAQPFQLIASAPIDGPYDIHQCWTKLCDESSPPTLCTPIATRIYMSYRRIYRFKEKMRNVFQQEYYRKIRKIDNGRHNAGDMLDDLPETVQKLMNKDFLAEVRSGEHPLAEAMTENNTYDFLPVTPTRLYHSNSDELVPYATSEMTCAHMKSLGASDVDVVDSGDHTIDDSSHLGSFYSSLPMIKEWFDTFN